MGDVLLWAFRTLLGAETAAAKGFGVRVSEPVAPAAGRCWQGEEHRWLSSPRHPSARDTRGSLPDVTQQQQQQGDVQQQQMDLAERWEDIGTTGAVEA